MERDKQGTCDEETYSASAAMFVVLPTELEVIMCDASFFSIMEFCARTNRRGDAVPARRRARARGVRPRPPDAVGPSRAEGRARERGSRVPATKAQG